MYKIGRLLLAVAMTPVGGSFVSAGGNETCKEISEQQILAIVQHELMKRFGVSELWDDKTSKIWRSGCDYYYAEDRVPYYPGDHFAMRIDQDGNVVEYIPGL